MMTITKWLDFEPVFAKTFDRRPVYTHVRERRSAEFLPCRAPPDAQNHATRPTHARAQLEGSVRSLTHVTIRSWATRDRPCAVVSDSRRHSARASQASPPSGNAGGMRAGCSHLHPHPHLHPHLHRPQRCRCCPSCLRPSGPPGGGSTLFLNEATSDGPSPPRSGAAFASRPAEATPL